ncbi:hypothetical protein [Pseudoxanthomonas sp. PXM02]|uniref:hypothetical protein n=1 Tax=Pseudoxanthomonas sp. PXM02 TaxID=2769294 RepID=UPI00177FDC3F|nr:hypothetical protein [Pseudoxanthomonas sp. PXM02]MBD9481206.1 hypothetical protein [Pseudoxanthomonas sp. PXM02]
MLDKIVASQLDSELARCEQDLQLVIEKLINEHAARGFSTMQGPIAGRIIDACDHALVQVHAAAQLIQREYVVSGKTTDDQAERLRALLGHLEPRLMRLALTPTRYVDALGGVTPPELASRVPWVLGRLRASAFEAACVIT